MDARALRSVMRRVPSPVAVVTAVGRGEARGMTISSLTRVSLRPPLVSFNVEREAQMHAVLAEASSFAVHLVGEEQAALCERFAAPDRTGADQLRGLAQGIDGFGNPVLEGALAVLHCRLYAAYPAGDHSILVGEVVGVWQQEGGTPLVYFDRAYHGVGARVLDRRAPVPDG
ncbi:MAG: flavin reductase family protein [Longimicrobiaceae bacterium]